MDNNYPKLESFENEITCGDNCNCSECNYDNPALDNTGPTSDDEGDEMHDPLQISEARNKKAALHGQRLAPRVKRILDAIFKEGFTLSLFLDALSWGDKSCYSDPQIRYARTGLLLGEQLPHILDRWYKPPRNDNKGPRPAGALKTLRTFSVKCVTRILEQEMEQVAPEFSSLPAELSQGHLTSFDFNEFSEVLQHKTPVLWKVMERVSYSDKQRIRNSHKSPNMVCLCTSK